MKDSAYFLAKAARARRLADANIRPDDKAYQALLEMAEEYERLAREALQTPDAQEDKPGA